MNVWQWWMCLHCHCWCKQTHFKQSFSISLSPWNDQMWEVSIVFPPSIQSQHKQTQWIISIIHPILHLSLILHSNKPQHTKRDVEGKWKWAHSLHTTWLREGSNTINKSLCFTSHGRWCWNHFSKKLINSTLTMSHESMWFHNTLFQQNTINTQLQFINFYHVCSTWCS